MVRARLHNGRNGHEWNPSQKHAYLRVFVTYNRLVWTVEQFTTKCCTIIHIILYERKYMFIFINKPVSQHVFWWAQTLFFFSPARRSEQTQRIFSSRRSSMGRAWKDYCKCHKKIYVIRTIVYVERRPRWQRRSVGMVITRQFSGGSEVNVAVLVLLVEFWTGVASSLTTNRMARSRRFCSPLRTNERFCGDFLFVLILTHLEPKILK